MIRKSSFLFLALVLCSPTYGKTKGEPLPPLALSICSVLSQAGQYDGKDIRVRGIYRADKHGSEFFGSECESRENKVNMREADTKAHKQFAKAMRNVDASQPLDMVIRGRFSVAKTGCFGAVCDRYEIKETWLLWVHPVQGAPLRAGAAAFTRRGGGLLAPSW